MPVVAANNASDEGKKRANYICDGVADEIEIQAAINGSPYMLQGAFKGEQWLEDAKSYWTVHFRAIEERLLSALQYVQLDRRNRKTFSPVFASILKDMGSTFDSVLNALVRGAGVPPRRKYYDIRDYCDFLKREVVDVHRQSVHLRPLHPKGLVGPFEELRVKDGVPEWWNAYNKVKH